MWSKYYARPLAELIAVVAQPFDDDDTNLAESTVEAQRVARRQVQDLFAANKRPPSGGQIEVPLLDIACRLLDVLRTDEDGVLATERLMSAIATLDGNGSARRRVVNEELEVPDIAKNLEGDVPFGMWR